MIKLTGVLAGSISFRKFYYLRCLYYCTEPKDTISPPTKVWRYVTDKYIAFVKKYENKLEKKSPKAFNVYQTIKSVRYIAADTKDYLAVAKDIWSGRELHTFSRKELELYQEMPADMVKIISLLLIFTIPFVGNMFVVLGYYFPKTFFTHHLWNAEQKVEFEQHFLKPRLGEYHHILDAFEKQVEKYCEGELKTKLSFILNKVSHSGYPSVEELLEVKSQFETFPLSLDSLPTFYLRHVAKSFNCSKRRSQLEQDGLILLHIDRALAREGINNLTDQEMCRACAKRGLNPYGIMRFERIEFLENWTKLSAHLDERSVSLLLHSHVLLTYNRDTNITLMKGRKYRWRRTVE